MAKSQEDLRREALEDIRNCEAEIARLLTRRDERRVFLRVLSEMSPHTDEVAANDRGSSESEFATSDEIADCVRSILYGAIEPVHISKLYDEVIARGLRISGKNPKGNLSAKLSPYEDIHYVKDKGWKLSEFSQYRTQVENEQYDQKVAAGDGVRTTIPRQSATPNTPAWAKGG